MKKSRTFLFILFLFTVPQILHAQDSETSIFWKISGNGLEKPSYLFGTVHMIGESDFFMPDSAEPAFKSCDEIVLEMDLDDPALAAKMQPLLFMKNETIKNLLDSNGYSQLQNYFRDSIGMPIEQLQNIKPIFLAQFIVPKIINQPLASYELKFVELAKKYNKELTGLETVEEQVAVVDNIPYKRQAELTLETITDLNDSRDLYTKMISGYKSGDISGFYQTMLEMSKEFEEFDQFLLTGRNIKWIPRIEDKIKQKSSFIAVGALHLAGEKGLVSLLRARGYILTPL